MPELKANIYSLGELPPEKKEKISAGLDILGHYAGGIAIHKFLRVKLPTDSQGEVNTNRISGNGLDRSTGIHIFAVPGRDFWRGSAGRAYVQTGLAFVDPRNDAALSTTVAHEAAHSLGFVVADAPQSAKVDPGHCGSPQCIMYPKVVVAMHDESNDFYEGFPGVESLYRNMGRLPLPRMDYSLVPQDFCTPCKADIRDLTEQHVAEMLLHRVSTGSVMLPEAIDRSVN